MVDDEALLTAWRAGDQRAGSELFHRHFDAVFRFFRNKVDRGVDDLVQRTFTRCVEFRQSIKKDSAFRAFLFGVARNVLREHYRGLKRRAREIDFERESVVDLGASPHSLIDGQRQQRLLLEGLRRISLEDQTLLELYYWERLTGVDLGEFLGVNENTARTRLRRARLRLEKTLAELEASRELLQSTIENLDRWAEGVRLQLAVSRSA